MNLYAEQFISSHNLAPHSRAHGWKKATHDLSELKKLLALIIVMGLVNYPTLEDFWATFFDPLLMNFQAAYVLRRDLSLDEAMIGFKGRLGFIQYLPKKPQKWGMKAFVLADSITGYTYRWRLYTGSYCQRLHPVLLPCDADAHE